MTFKLAFHPLARVDLIEASTWREVRELGLGERLETQARAIFERLKHDALHYAVRFGDIRRVNLPSFPYGVFYFVSDDRVVVIGILHGVRDSEAELQRRRETYG